MSGWVDAWFLLIATSPAGGSASRPSAYGMSSRPWNVDTTGTGAILARSRLTHSRWLWMTSNSRACLRTLWSVSCMNGRDSPV